MPDDFSPDVPEFEFSVTVAEVGAILDPDSQFKDGIPDLVAHMSTVVNYVARVNRAMEVPEFAAHFNPEAVMALVHELCHEVEELGDHGYYYFMGFMGQFMDGLAAAAQIPDTPEASSLGQPEYTATLSAMMYVIRTVTVHWHGTHPEISVHPDPNLN